MKIEGAIAILLSAIVAAAISYMFLRKKKRSTMISQIQGSEGKRKLKEEIMMEIKRFQQKKLREEAIQELISEGQIPIQDRIEILKNLGFLLQLPEIVSVDHQTESTAHVTYDTVASASLSSEELEPVATKTPHVMNLTVASNSISSADSKSTINAMYNTISSGSFSSAGSEPAATKRAYEVFLSFCGKDTRNGFTDFLYTYLKDASIQTFRDDNELRVGEKIGPELLKAIKESKISIPILSEQYASSTWCLLEIAEMVDCHTNGEHVIYPIFYDVNPSDVRNQRGSYELAFREHENNYDVETVKRWMGALKTVGQLKGLELKKETNGREGELVKMVTQKVLVMLKKNYTILPKNLVGIDKSVETLAAVLKVDTGGIRVVGIHGMGGLGKTTISKATYNQLCDNFESHCFLDDVRENSKQDDGIRRLQSQLISKIQRRGTQEVYNVNAGRSLIKDAVSGRKVLLVLDDVDNISQVDMLMGSHSWYGANSRIIITTRDTKVLNAIKGPKDVFATYKPDYMSDDDSIQLFSKFAFMRDSPIEGFEHLSKEVVSIAAGLPLVLVVLGSTFFREKDISFWEAKLKMLRMIPEKEVLEKLKLSFDALECEQQQIFLDIACFFIGDDLERASYMWDDYEWFPLVGIRALTSKSFITFDDNNKVIMHDQLRDLGREIVRREGLNDSGKRSRLWRKEDALKILNTSQVSQNVEALSLPFKDGIPLLLPSSFRGIPNLRYLRFWGQTLDGNFQHLFSKLRWLRLQCEVKFMPTNLHMENLVILHLSFAKDWQGLSQLNMGMKLKVLDLTGCRGLTVLPNLSAYPSLEILNLSLCKGLCRFDGLEQLKSLRYMYASECKNLETLPNLSNLTNLIKLELSFAKVVEIQGLEKLESLEYLSISNCHSIERLRDLSNLKKMKHLLVARCNKLIEVSGVNKLNSLEVLNLVHCESLKGILDITNMCNLVEVNAPTLDTTGSVNSKLLQKLEVSVNVVPIKFLGLNALRFLIIRGGSMKRLPDLSYLKSLKEIEIRACNKLITIEGICELESLEKLVIQCCHSIATLPFLSNFRNLQHIFINDCRKLIEIHGLYRMESLKVIRIKECFSLERFPDLPNFGMLKEIYLRSCDGLQEFHGNDVIESLERLDLRICWKLREISGLRCFKSLNILVIYNLPKLTKVDGLEELKSLEYLTCAKCKSIEELPEFSKLEKLKLLFASECVKLRDIKGLEDLQSLEFVIVNGCKSLGDLSCSPNTRVQRRNSSHPTESIPFVHDHNPLEYYRRNI